MTTITGASLKSSINSASDYNIMVRTAKVRTQTVFKGSRPLILSEACCLFINNLCLRSFCCLFSYLLLFVRTITRMMMTSSAAPAAQISGIRGLLSPVSTDRAFTTWKCTDFETAVPSGFQDVPL